MIKITGKYFRAALLGGCLLFTLESCSLPLTGTTGGGGYSAAATAVIASSEKNRTEQALGSGIWQAKTAEGTPYAEVWAENIDTFMTELEAIQSVAEERGVKLTGAEKKAMNRAADEYMQALTDGDKENLGGVTKEDVRKLYQDYLLAQRTAEDVSGNEALEVSDSEAKVIRVLYAVSDDRDAAQAVHDAAESGTDFATAARAEGLEVQNASPCRGECGDDPDEKTLEDAEFALAEGEESGVVESGGKYYVIRCVDDYDETATAARKEQMFRARLAAAFEQLLGGRVQKAASASDFRRAAAEYVKLQCPSEADFFEIYHKYADSL